MTARHQQTQERESRMCQLPVGQIDEMGRNVPLQVIDVHHRNIQRQRQPLGERNPDHQRAEQSRPAGKSDPVQILQVDAGLPDRRIDHRNDVLLMRPRRQLRDHAAVLAVNVLTGNNVRQQRPAPNHRGGSIVARRFDTQDRNIHFGFIIYNKFSKLVVQRDMRSAVTQSGSD